MNVERRAFRVLYQHFLSRFIDPAVLSSTGETRNLLVQFAAVLLAFSFVYMVVRVPALALATVPREILSAASWSEEEFLISTTMLVAGIAATLAWNTAYPDRQDATILSLLPLRPRTMLAAKTAAIGTSLAVSIATVNGFTGLSYPLVVVPPGGNAAGSLVVWWLTMAAAGLFIWCSILSLQNLATLILGHRVFLKVSGLLQLLIFFMLPVIWLTKPPLPARSALTSPEAAVALQLIPSFWFFGLFQHLSGSAEAAIGVLARRAGLGLIGAAGLFAISYPFCFLRNMRRIVEQPDIAASGDHRLRRRFLAIAARLFFDRPLERAIFLFTARCVARSRQHRLILAAYIGLGLAIALAYCRDLFYQSKGHAWHAPNVELLGATFILLFSAVIGLRATFALPVALSANWIFRVTAVHRPSAYFKAVRKSLFAFTAAPLWAAAAIMLLAIWPGRPVLGHLALLALVAIVVVYRSLSRFRKMPFACSYAPGKSNLNVKLGPYGLLFLFLADIGVRLEVWSLQKAARYAVLFSILLAAAIWTRRRTLEFATAPENRLQFDDSPGSELQVLDLRQDGAWLRDDAYVDAIDPAFGRTFSNRVTYVALGALALMACGVLYEQVGQWRERARLPQVGQLVDIGGRRLNIFCSGTGTPAVILESGHAMPGYSWVHIQREIARFTRACWYDRAGRGWSDPGPDRFYADAVAADLHALLKTTGVPPPYVLVGHSIGGLYIRVFTGLHPADVAGLVFVDPTHEDLPHDRPTPEFVRQTRLVLTEIFGRMGLFRLVAEAPATAPKHLTPSDVARMSALVWRYQNQVANIKGVPVEPSAEQARAAGGLENLPMIVLAAETTHAGVSEEYEATRIEILKKFARRSARGRYMTVSKSSHMMPFDAPEAIVAAVRQLVQEFRSGGAGQ